MKEEKRNRAPGRKGNVVEPLMSWYCLFMMFGTPFCQLLHWQYANEIIPFHFIPEWLCVLLMALERCISFWVVYNSLFVAAIRYGYIVHQQKWNAFDFEKIGRRFQLASVLIPFGMEMIFFSTHTNHVSNAFKMGKEKIEICNENFTDLNVTLDYLPPGFDPNPPSLVQTLISEKMSLIIHYAYIAITALVSLNIIEAFLYMKIFGCIKR